ncbi:steroid monooxygenase [Luminiphilus syltensis NOR5-1B]|uniref:Steroid monooxygenase n=1 Tax=Luminiphilus syltensis NOR5-1B TaxID=565045 RepID=B8KUI5_9GAMM|nr:NAD(P)/FAD-dependent oxidoreductase [Luminiphilus syltensis]EED36345.1 steroid monooxygenase [Luminiphilus syltensis NOR5-1B]
MQEKKSKLIDAVIVGAGFAGLRALYTLRKAGLSCLVIEASDEVGGVWNYNRYPGARCDVESYDYSYGFSRELENEWRWTERYAKQGEILEYIRHVADRFDLKKDISFKTRLESAQYDESHATWNIETSKGDRLTARFFIMAVGQLSKPKKPDIKGESSFKGNIYHSALWPREKVDFTGKRVGIIGTGSSGVQMTPVISDQADHLCIFQRTANYSIPACHAHISDEEDASIKADYKTRREQARNSPSGLGFVPNGASALDDPPDIREKNFEEAWNRLGFGFALVYKDILLNEEANDVAKEFVHRKIAEKVHDPVVREKLTPKGFPFGAMRPAVDHLYYESFNRENVELVDIKEDPIQEITETGIRTENNEYPLDIIIFATGFDVFTGSLLAPEIVGRNGVTLRERWKDGPKNYLGLSTVGFPNMFIMVGPGSPSLLSNVLVSTEDHADFIRDLIVNMKEAGMDEVEANAEAELQWVEHVNEHSKKTLYPKAASYYMGAEVPGKPHVFMPYSGGVRSYRRTLYDVMDNDWKGFDMHAIEERDVR